MPDHDLLTDPRPGDCVSAFVRGECVTRKVLPIYSASIYFNDSRKTEECHCSREAWIAWCRRNKAQVVKE